jgi:hypothetical protein
MSKRFSVGSKTELERIVPDLGKNSSPVRIIRGARFGSPTTSGPGSSTQKSSPECGGLATHEAKVDIH